MMNAATSDLIAAEITAARIEAMTTVDPAAGHLWRAEAALCEAVDSAGLEGIRISTTDLLPRVAFNGGHLASDVPAAELALDILSVLKSPGNPLLDPVAVMRRMEQAALIARTAGAEEAFSSEPPLHLSETDARMVFACLSDGDPPILAAARAAACYGALTDRQSPLIERLVFVAMESALRSQQIRSGLAFRANARLGALGTRISGRWIVLPSTALTRPRFLPWSPGSAKGLADLLAGLKHTLSEELGRMGVIMSWVDRAEALGEGRHGKSRLADAAQAFADHPLMTASDLSDRIAVTPRGAANHLTALVGEGLVVEVTRRRSSRIWATPNLASRLVSVNPPVVTRTLHSNRTVQHTGDLMPATSIDERMDAMDDAFKAFEDSMAKADLLLAKYKL
jgi:hypothetical protein